MENERRGRPNSRGEYGTTNRVTMAASVKTESARKVAKLVRDGKVASASAFIRTAMERELQRKQYQ